MNKIILFVFIIIIAIIYNLVNQKNVINKFYSANKKFSFISKLEDGNINIYEKKLIYKKKIKNSDKYKKILSVDNRGNILYASISAKPHYASRSRIYFNEQQLKVNPGTHASAINYDNIFVWKFFHYLTNEKRFWLYFYDAKLQKVRYIILGNKFPEKVFFLDKQHLYIETFDGVKTESFTLDLDDFNLRSSYKINISKNFLKESLILNNKSMSSEQIQLINYFNEEFANNDPSGNLSKLDNYEGRLSWYISKKLEALINIHELYKKNLISLNKYYDLQGIINEYIGNILKSYERIENKAGWPTKKYSKDKNTKLYLSVNNSTIFYPLLLSINSDLINDENRKKKILSLFELFFDQHEKNFLYKKNVYIINNDNFPYKGIEPLNFQSQFGLCLIEAYKATKNTKYLDKIILLANSIKTQITLLEDGSLIWPYHYSEHANLLSNQEKKIGEDMSHASINVNFLLESSDLLGKSFYFADLNNKLNYTLDKNMYLEKLEFNSHLNDDSSKSYKYLPKSYWLKLENKKLNYIHLKNLIAKDNYFENSRLLSFSILLKNSFKFNK